MNSLGTEYPLKIAIIGSGPSGFYAAEALLRSSFKVKIDIFEYLPTPYGLVRGGVAPDHQKMKTVTSSYEKIALHEDVRFLGNVCVGKDLSIEELKKYYDAIIFSYGTYADRRLHIPGEDLNGIYTSTKFIGWYNGQPDYRNHSFDFSGENAVIIGMGNVAMDVARILAKTPEELKDSDIPEHVLETLSKSKIKNIYLIGRRGPVQSAFFPYILKEFENLKNFELVIDPQDLILNENSKKEMEDPLDFKSKKNYELIKQYSLAPISNKPKKIYMIFFKTPISIQGKNNQVEKIILAKNNLVGEPGNQISQATEETIEIPCNTIFCSIGYKGIPMPGIPFDNEKHVISNNRGRIINENGKPLIGFYTSGWIKRGPSGVINSNKVDSVETVNCLLEDIPNIPPGPIRDQNKILDLLKQKNIRVVTFDEWKKLDQEEIRRGKEKGKPREKFVTVKEMLDFLEIKK